MKIISFIFMVGISLCASLCCNEKENDYLLTDNYVVENDGLIAVQNNTSTIMAGEVIYVETRIEDQQTNVNENTFNVSNFTSIENPLQFELVLYRLNVYGNIERVAISQEHIEEVEGNAYVYEENNAPFISLSTAFNNNLHSNITGFTILESGTYYIGANYYDNNFGEVTISVNSDFGSIRFFTKIINSNTNGLYELTVN